MSKTVKSGSSSFWAMVMSFGILACLGGVAYTFFMIQQETGQEDEYRLTAYEMRLLSQQISLTARESVHGEESTFNQLDKSLESFEWQLTQLQAEGLQPEVKAVEERWQAVRDSAQTLIAAGSPIVFINSVSTTLEKNIRPIQSEFAAVVELLRDDKVSAETIVAGQKVLWLTERIARNIDKILAGGVDSQLAADEFRSDASDVVRIVDALNNGSQIMGVDKMTDPEAKKSLDTAAAMFSVVSKSIDEIAGASVELREAAMARESIAL